MITKEYGGGIDAFIKVLNTDTAYVNVAFYAIQRRYQQENLARVPEEKLPEKERLKGYVSRQPQAINYYQPDDLFLELGDWLRDYNINERKGNESSGGPRPQQQPHRSLLDQKQTPK